MNTLWYDKFLEELYKKFPKKSHLTEALMNLLSIEREATYRRLRKNIIFPAQELVKIASTWNISLDNLVGIEANQFSFRGQFLHYIDPSEHDLKYLKNLLQDLKKAINIPDIEYMEVANELPRSLTSGYPYLSRCYLLKWMHQYKDEILPFSKIFFKEKITNFSGIFHDASKKIAKTVFIWDPMLFNYLVSDIRYFYSIYLITDEEKECIKNDLLNLLDYMSEVATKGCWPETGNKVYLYISHININTNYNYYYSEEFKLCRVNAFAKSEIYTTSPEMTEDFVAWMQLKKRASVKISDADERSRIEFFMKQRELVNAL